MRIFYHLDGGLPSRIAEWAVAPTVRRHMKEALRRLQRSIEAQPPRRRRTQRPATETGSDRVMSTSTPASAEP